MNVNYLIAIIATWVVFDIGWRVRIGKIGNQQKRERYIDYFLFTNILGLLVLFFYLYKTYMIVAAADA